MASTGRNRFDPAAASRSVRSRPDAVPNQPSCFSGRIGSGKSSVAARLSHALGWPRAGFGEDLRRRIAQEGCDRDSRHALQDLGQTLVDANPDPFWADLASAGFVAGGNLILDHYLPYAPGGRTHREGAIVRGIVDARRPT